MRDGGKEMEREEERSILFQSNSLGNSEKQSLTKLYLTPHLQMPVLSMMPIAVTSLSVGRER